MGLSAAPVQKNLQKPPILLVFPFTSHIPSLMIDIVRTRSGKRNGRKMFWMVTIGREFKGDLWQRKE
jgi:hypothetical protein